MNNTALIIAKSKPCKAQAQATPKAIRQAGRCGPVETISDIEEARGKKTRKSRSL